MKLESEGFSPGYRDVSFVLVCENGKKIQVRLDLDESQKLWRFLNEVNALAWRGEPLDKRAWESRVDFRPKLQLVFAPQPGVAS